MPKEITYFHPENEPSEAELRRAEMFGHLRKVLIFASIPLAICSTQLYISYLHFQEYPKIACTKEIRGTVTVTITRLSDDDDVKVYKIDGVPECYNPWFKDKSGREIGWDIKSPFRVDSPNKIIEFTIKGNDGTRFPYQPLKLSNLARSNSFTGIKFNFPTK